MMGTGMIRCGAVVMGMMGAPYAAGAASVSYSTAFNMDFYLEAVSADPGGPFWYRGDQTVMLSQFDTLGGTRTLNKVTLQVDNTIHAQIDLERDVLQINPPAVPGAIEIENLHTYAAAPSAAAPALALQYWMDEPIVDAPAEHAFSYALSESDTGDNSTNDPLDLLVFIGGGDVTVDVRSRLRFSYDGAIFDFVKSEAGAYGTVTVTYDYSTADGGDGNVVPTPAAFGMGLLMMAGMALRHRR